ncbi:MAG: metal ABC transporter permease [Pseudomonadota bacterium]
MIDFVMRAVVAGLAIAAIAGPLGCFVVWRRMSYFGDTLAHSALLGIAFAILMDVHMQLAIVVSCLVFSALLIGLEKKGQLATDTLLGILAHGTLAFGLLLLSLSNTVQVNLTAYLFGDLLTVQNSDLWWILGCSALVAVLLWRYWSRFLSMTVHAELSQVEGLPVGRLYALLVVLVALLIAVAMKIVGVLLITALLIIPPAAARRVSATPEQMAVVASLIGCLSVGLGLTLSWYEDTPAGPSIVAAACLCFAVLYLVPLRRQ